MADTQLERFSCGFYEESIEDKILLTYIETKATKKNRGYELKKMALEYLKDMEYEIYESLYKEFSSTDKEEIKNNINGSSIIQEKIKQRDNKGRFKIEDTGTFKVYLSKEK
ncbi:MAG: hypothetical protein KZY57_09155 [Paeniclostridium sp.]|nr:hypothetical protein [Paeniclostridium sp.]MBW4862982.1 hypothetical protein [Paeniclostridium sp.]